MGTGWRRRGRAIARAVVWTVLGAALLACGDAAPEPGASADGTARAGEATAPDDPQGTVGSAVSDEPVAPDTAEGSDGGDRADLPDDTGSTGGPGLSDVADDESGIQDGLQTQASPPDGSSYWLLTEFDWGDDREVVYESTRFDPFYTCRKKKKGICALTRVSVDGEDLLADFHFNERDRLFQMAFLTPNLTREQADAHLERVWKGLRDYVTQHRGAPELSGSLPDLDSLEPGPPQETHVWHTEGLDVRLAVGLRDADAYYAIAWFTDPSQPEARRVYLARLEASDRTFRERRKAGAAEGS